MQRMRVRAFVLTAVIAGLFVGALLGEISLRLYVAFDRKLGEALREFDPMAVQIEPIGALGYRQRPNSVFHYANGTTATSNALGYRGPLVETTPEPGTVRIILLGGSTTHGFGVVDSETIDAYMRRILPDRHPGTRFEVVNLAFDGYDTFQLLERFRTQGLALHPTIVVMNEGINDVRNAWFPHLRDIDSRTLIWEDVLVRLREERRRGGPTMWTLVKHYSLLARTPGYIRDQLRHRRENERHEAELAHSTTLTSAASAGGPPYPAAADYFERNVRSIVALALAHGARVLLSTPPSALRSYPPNATSNRGYWVRDAKTTQEYRDLLAERLRHIAADDPETVHYIAPQVPLAYYLDDCHLTKDGNRLVAEAFSDAIDEFLGAARRSMPAAQPRAELPRSSTPPVSPARRASRATAKRLEDSRARIMRRTHA